MKFRKEQIERIFTGLVNMTSVSINGTSADVTTSLTTALTTAGFGGGAIALTNSASESAAGVVVTATNNLNRAQVFLSSTKKPLYYAGEKVFGKLTYSASVYTLTLYYNNAGVDTVYNTGGAVSFDVLVPYRYAFKDIPSDFFSYILQKYPYVDFNASTNQGRTVEEKLNVTALNTISSLTYVPTVGTKVTLLVNGKSEFNTGATPSFTVSGNVITWSATNAEYPVKTTFSVFARYQTLS